MPAYISHAIMGKDLYEKLKSNKLLEIEVSKKEIKGYSLGIDLSTLSYRLSGDPHNDSTRDFFLYMINYIKKNNLYKNEHAISLLYGHIAHYYLDLNIHPYINYIANNTIQYGLIPNHHLIEGYISSYLAKAILGIDRLKITHTYFDQIDLTEDAVSNILTDTYKLLYKEPNIIVTYRKVMSIFSKIEMALSKSKLKKSALVTISGFKRFLKKNNLKETDLTNENHNPYYRIDNKMETLSLLEMYNKAINDSLSAIYEVNKYIYKNASLEQLNNVFEDISYDTGISCQKTKILTLRRKLAH